MKRFLFVIIILLIACLCNGCGDRKVDVTIENKGIHPLKSATLYVSGNSYALGDIDPNKSKSVELEVTGESHIELAQAGGKRLIIEVYIEPGYGGSVQAIVTPETVLSVINDIEIIEF